MVTRPTVGAEDSTQSGLYVKLAQLSANLLSSKHMRKLSSREIQKTSLRVNRLLETLFLTTNDNRIMGQYQIKPYPNIFHGPV
jgi:hypothetical protein